MIRRLENASAPQRLPEPLRNQLLRRVDWRFLLRRRDLPRAVDLTSSPISEALPLVSESAPRSPGSADLVLTGFPTRRVLKTARTVLRPGGEVVCVWRVPRPAGVQRAIRRLERAGFTDTRPHWPGPLPYRQPEFWLPLRAGAAVEHVLAQRPARSRLQAFLRLAWRAAARSGLLAPIYSVAQVPGAAEDRADPQHAVDDRALGSPSWVLLTGGHLSVNRVVGLPFVDGQSAPSAIVKFARVPEADSSLERESRNLQKLEEERPRLAGVPRLRADGWRSGRRAIVQSAVYGQPMVPLAPGVFAEVAPRVTDYLVDLAGDPTPRPAAEWRQRLISDPVTRFERSFGSLLEPGTIERTRSVLSEIGDLPVVWEHRDCGPWNIVLDPGGAPALLDWETAEPRGLPGLDLAYFLATAAFVMDGIDTNAAGAADPVRESHERLLDPTAEPGRTAASCVAEYCARLGLDAATFARLRLLCWIVQSVADHSGLRLELGAEPPSDALRASVFPGLVEQQLRRMEGRR